jgi:hypothetical protein
MKQLLDSTGVTWPACMCRQGHLLADSGSRLPACLSTHAQAATARACAAAAPVPINAAHSSCTCCCELLNAADTAAALLTRASPAGQLGQCWHHRKARKACMYGSRYSRRGHGSRPAAAMHRHCMARYQLLSDLPVYQ